MNIEITNAQRILLLRQIKILLREERVTVTTSNIRLNNLIDLELKLSSKT